MEILPVIRMDDQVYFLLIGFSGFTEKVERVLRSSYDH